MGLPRGTDLMMVGRFGANYQAPYSDITNLLDDDELMIQRGSTKYRVKMGDLRNGNNYIKKDDYFLFQRGDTLYGYSPQEISASVPKLQLMWDKADAGSNFGPGKPGAVIKISWTGAQPIGETLPQLAIDSKVFFLPASGTISYTYDDFKYGPPAGTQFAQLRGTFTSLKFKDSLGLKIVQTQGSGSEADIFPEPVQNFGYEMFSGCINLTEIPTKFPWRSLVQTFMNCEKFNQNLGELDARQVVFFDQMFQGAKLYNQQVASWKLSKVQSMISAFSGAAAFDQPLNDWGFYLSLCEDFRGCFNGALAFNKPLNNWNVSGATGFHALDGMFQLATTFSQDLTGWCVPTHNTEPPNFSTGSALTQFQLPVWGTCP